MSTTTETASPFSFKSTIAELALPRGGFVSKLPPHLLQDADPQTAWIMHEMSKNTQATEFACHAVLEQNAHLRALNGKTYRNEKGLAEAKETVAALNKKAEVMEPMFKPLSQFMSLWEYAWFRYICYAAGFFFLTYALPYYVAHPVSIQTVFTKLFGP